eukprot:1611172-Amphidinium_carterae.2
MIQKQQAREHRETGRWVMHPRLAPPVIMQNHLPVERVQRLLRPTLNRTPPLTRDVITEKKDYTF